jgi:hypothetical protein
MMRVARELLRASHESFSHKGAEAFAERARRELRATGETVRRVTADTRDVLTPITTRKELRDALAEQAA